MYWRFAISPPYISHLELNWVNNIGIIFLLFYLYVLAMLVDFICLVTRYVVVIVDWGYFNFIFHWNLSHTPKFICVIWFSNSQQLMPIVGKMSNLVKWASWVQIGTSKSSLQTIILACWRKRCKWLWHNRSVQRHEGWSCDVSWVDKSKEARDDRQGKECCSVMPRRYGFEGCPKECYHGVNVGKVGVIIYDKTFDS